MKRFIFLLAIVLVLAGTKSFVFGANRSGLILGQTITCKFVQNHYPITQTSSFDYGDQVWVHTSIINLCTKGEFKYKWTLPDGTTTESGIKTFDPRSGIKNFDPRLDCWTGLKIYDTYIGLPAGETTIELYSKLLGETSFTKETTVTVTVSMTETYVVGDLVSCAEIVDHQPVTPTTSFLYGERVNVHQALDRLCVKTDFKFVYTLPGGTSEESGVKTFDPENYCWTENVGVYDYRDGLPLGSTTVKVLAKTDTETEYTEIGSVTVTISTSITYELGDLASCAEIVDHQPVTPTTSFAYGDRVNVHQNVSRICAKSFFKFVYKSADGTTSESGIKEVNPGSDCWTDVAVYDYRNELPLGENTIEVHAKVDGADSFAKEGEVTVTVTAPADFTLGETVTCKSIVDHQPEDVTFQFEEGETVNVHATITQICAHVFFKYRYTLPNGSSLESGVKDVEPGLDCWEDIAIYDSRDDLPAGTTVIELLAKKEGEDTYTLQTTKTVTLASAIPASYDYSRTGFYHYDPDSGEIGSAGMGFEPGEDLAAKIQFKEICGDNNLKTRLSINGGEVTEVVVNVSQPCGAYVYEPVYSGLSKRNYTFEILMSTDGGDNYTLIDTKRFSVRDVVNIVPIINLLLLQE